MNARVIFFCLLIGLSTSAWTKSTFKSYVEQMKLKQSTEKGDKKDNIQCGSIFKVVGDHCLFVDKDLFGTWQEMRVICQDLGGDLPNLKNANFLADIDDYFHNHYLDDVSYWVGSNDQVTEGVWQWANDNSQVKLGTPLWGDLADKVQQPTGGYSENCGVLLEGDHYYMHDAACSMSYSLLCEQSQLDHQQQKGLDKAGELSPTTTTKKPKTPSPTYPTTTHTGPNITQTTRPTIPTTSPWWYTTTPTTTDYIPADCPSPYQIIHGKCLFVNTLAKSSWHNQKTSCESLAGHMVKVDDANLLGALFDHLTQSVIKQEFWIGASDEQQEGNWFWHDGTDVHLGTPFWGDNGDHQQNPDGGVTNNCAYITYMDHYFINDGSCDASRFVICQIDIQ